MPSASNKILIDIRNLVAFHREIGIDTYPRSPEIEKFLKLTETKPVPATRTDLSGAGKISHGTTVPDRSPARRSTPPPPSPRPEPTKVSLTEIRQELGDCTRCPLHEHRQCIVFGAGNEKAQLLIIEDQPGPGEEQNGQPMSGAAGALLDRMLSAIGLSRDQVYITSLVKCAPLQGRVPEKQEIKTCLPFLIRQLASISPKLICAMGPLTAKTLTATDQTIFRLRGKFHSFQGFAVIPTFHPAFLLKNEEMKKPAWVDLQMVQQRLKG